MNKNTLLKKLILLKMLENNIWGNIYGNQEEELEKIKHKIIKYRNIKILSEEEQKDTKEKNTLIKSIEYNRSKNDEKDLLIIYMDKKYSSTSAYVIIKKWCQSINVLNYKIIDNFNSLSLAINDKQPKAILSCEEVELFLNQNLRIQIVRGFELRFKEIPIVFTYLPISQAKNPALKKEIWQDLKIIKGIIKYG
ncbi:hypothetical protein CR532_00060 [Candidatus Borreliella tachyglossi]|uniref:Uncharacterized protein n=1 Tax=Candidatus Borreliella tachyglossi TaxID=1964448 RepID=A0A2S1LVV1_9SPIR|nr:hypothetical protein [Candidatus Borreliella tachyglossi]AWG42419.1 hypothetical protein CR532_00060 [Candidatus Borreliella tachyglossi]